MRRLRPPALLPLMGLLALGCGIFDPSFPEPALIIFYSDTAQITAPDTAPRGATIQVSVPTFAGGCTRSVARTETTVSGSLIEIRPYNETRRGNVCTDDLLILTHTVGVRFNQSGLATIRVVAEQRPFHGAGTRTGPAAVEHHLVIQ